MVIAVPSGVVVYDDERLVGEILGPGERLLVCRGGRGGRGNAHFVSSTNRSPRKAEPGADGETKTLKLVLKIISDIGIVGMPNAGKSTLLKAMTSARPRIASYPFTTLSPNLGVLKSNTGSVVIADMPGIIEGAHRGKGIGLQFLRHIERTRMLVIVIDASVPDPEQQYEALIDEFKNYDEALLKKPRIVVVNKIDLLDRPPSLRFTEQTFAVSALRGTGIDRLMEHLQNAD